MLFFNFCYKFLDFLKFLLYLFNIVIEKNETHLENEMDRRKPEKIKAKSKEI